MSRTALQAKSPVHHTEEQSAILAAAGSGDSLLIEAGAGTGKTTALLGVAQRLARRRGLLMVYNRIAATATAPMLSGTGCEARTLHSLAYRSALARPIAQSERLKMALPGARAAEAGGIRSRIGLDARGDRLLGIAAQGHLLKQWVSRYCHSDDDVLAIRHFPVASFRELVNPDILFPGLPEARERWQDLARQVATSLLGAAQRLWAIMSGPDTQFPSTHDVYLKLYVMSRPRVPWDYVLLDEAQDANPLALQFFNLARQQGCQTVAVGDSHQQLYAWRGAVDAMRRITDTKRLALTQSFRFGSEVASVANAVLALQGSDFRLAGLGPRGTVRERIDRPTAIICRTNGEAIQAALDAAKRKRRAALCLNRDEMRHEIEILDRFRRDGKSTARQYCMFRSFEELEDLVDAGELPEARILLKLIEEHGAQAADALIADMAVGKSAEAINGAGRDVVCLTAHASKGLEFDRVMLAEDFMPTRKENEDDDDYRARLAQHRDELNVFYVAVTRARRALGVGNCALARAVTGDSPTGR